MLHCVDNNFTLCSAFLRDSDLMFLLKAFAFSVFLPTFFYSLFGFSLLRCKEGGGGGVVLMLLCSKLLKLSFGVCGCWGIRANSAGVSSPQQNARVQSRKCSVGVLTPACPVRLLLTA